MPSLWRLRSDWIYRPLCMKHYMFAIVWVPFCLSKTKWYLWLRILAFWSFRDFGLDRGQCARMQFRKKPLFLVTKKIKSRGSKRDQSASCPSRGERGCEGGLRPALHQYCSSARPSSNTGVPAQISSDWSNFFASIQSLTWSNSPSCRVQMHWACAQRWLSVHPLRACKC